MHLVETARSVFEITLHSLDTIVSDHLMGGFAKLRGEDTISWHQHPRDKTGNSNISAS